MAKHYAVTITAATVAVEPEVLAQRLAALLDRRDEEMATALGRGRLVLQQELSYGEALEIQRELSRRKIPAQVTAQAELSAEPLMVVDGGLLAAGNTAADGGAKKVQAPEQPAEAGGPDEPLASPTQGDSSGGWGALFPDLAEEVVADDEPPELESMEAMESIDDFGEDEAMAEVDEPLGAIPEEWEDNPFAEFVFDDEDGADGAIVAPSPEVTRSEEGPPENSGPARGAEERRFDAEKIENAFGGAPKARPPYQPKGFDQRAPHLPILAAGLSVVAPGAGQIYNGQPDKAQWYGMTFFLLYPWFDAVRQAWRRGEKVRTYYAPRPEDGVLQRVVSYMVKWWVAVAMVTALSLGTYSLIDDYRMEQEAHRQDLVLRDSLFVSHETVEIAVERAAKAAEAVEIDADEEAQEAARFTMDREERARRLYIMGYYYCDGGDYTMCEQAMGRVTALVPGNRDARRLQTWASLQSRGGTDREMPEVRGDVPTLEEFELELASEGVDIDDLGGDMDSWWNDDDEGQADD